MARFSRRSREALYTADQSLVRLFLEVVQEYDCSVLEGNRSMTRQKALVATGYSQTLNSKHLTEPSRAVDVAPYPIDWEDIERFHHFAGYVQAVADRQGTAIVWGGSWNNFKDLPHYELKET